MHFPLCAFRAEHVAPKNLEDAIVGRLFGKSFAAARNLGDGGRGAGEEDGLSRSDDEEAITEARPGFAKIAIGPVGLHYAGEG